MGDVYKDTTKSGRDKSTDERFKILLRILWEKPLWVSEFIVKSLREVTGKRVRVSPSLRKTLSLVPDHLSLRPLHLTVVVVSILTSLVSVTLLCSSREVGYWGPWKRPNGPLLDPCYRRRKGHPPSRLQGSTTFRPKESTVGVSFTNKRNSSDESTKEILFLVGPDTHPGKDLVSERHVVRWGKDPSPETSDVLLSVTHRRWETGDQGRPCSLWHGRLFCPSSVLSLI